MTGLVCSRRDGDAMADTVRALPGPAPLCRAEHRPAPRRPEPAPPEAPERRRRLPSGHGNVRARPKALCSRPVGAPHTRCHPLPAPCLPSTAMCHPPRVPRNLLLAACRLLHYSVPVLACPGPTPLLLCAAPCLARAISRLFHVTPYLYRAIPCYPLPAPCHLLPPRCPSTPCHLLPAPCQFLLSSVQTWPPVGLPGRRFLLPRRVPMWNSDQLGQSPCTPARCTATTLASKGLSAHRVVRTMSPLLGDVPRLLWAPNTLQPAAPHRGLPAALCSPRQLCD